LGRLRQQQFLNELNFELTANHPLFEKAKGAVARCYSQDDYLFLLNDNSYAIMHLTFSHKNIDGFPQYTHFSDLQSALEYIENEFLAEYEGS